VVVSGSRGAMAFRSEGGGGEAPGPSGNDFLGGGCQGRAGCGCRRGPTAAGARDDNTGCGSTSGPDGARVSGNRRRSGRLATEMTTQRVGRRGQ
jgi:hypothetical protein